LDKETESVVVAKGGRGGLGNRHTQEATLGEEGEKLTVILDLKVIADVGIVGFPNAGKSTLISQLTNAHPKIAAYPFTTRLPVLGKINQEDASYIIADIPGLIKGSHSGRGLGDRFLRHVERTRVLIHLIDIAATDGRDPVSDYITLNQELKLYSSQLQKKPQILVANKMDLSQAKENLKKFKAKVKKSILPISAKEAKGLEELIDAIKKRL
jgi:GTP-binding protein